jgi:Domain of unknown function (DUF4432)
MGIAHLLTDRCADVYLDSFALGPRDVEMGVGDWSVRKRVLHGGLSEGVEVVEVDNGALSFTILPTRGMGLWKGKYKGKELSWSSPMIGPVHPKFVELSGRGGLGWLTGFDEWLCRCGLAWNGPPGDDDGFPLTLHGRIANQPAHRLEVQVDPQSKQIRVIGEVEEGGLFFPHLQLTTAYTTELGSNRIIVEDAIVNRSSQQASMQLLYHLNIGPPFLAAGSQVHIPIRDLWPNNERAAEGIASWNRYEPPTNGFAEQVYLIHPRNGADGRTLALLHDAEARIGVAVRWDLSNLPCFNLWKNTAALEDGYVTGLEPATGFPRFRARERAAGRVRTLPPGALYETNWTIEVLDTAEQVGLVVEEVSRMQESTAPVIHREVPP